MTRRSFWVRSLFGVVGLTVAVAFAALGYWWVSRHASAPLPETGHVTVEATVDSPDPLNLLPEELAQTLVEKLGNLLDADKSAKALVDLRQQVVALNRENSPHTGAAICVLVDGMARRFSKLDEQTRGGCFSIMAEALAWFEKHASPLWPRLIQPSEEMVRQQLATPKAEPRLQALHFVRLYWEWLPAGTLTEAQKKLIGDWKAALHEAASELLAAPDGDVREAAIRAVAAAPLDEAARDALQGLEDRSAAVRRTTLIALAERRTVLPNEQILPLLNDPNYDVRATARLVLSSRGVSQEEISIATLAFSPITLARVQAARHLAVATAVDRTVWLGHLAGDEEAEVRAEAARALAHVATPPARQRLARMAKQDPDPSVRELAQQLLAALGEPIDSHVQPASATTPQQ
jgi:HEAT repeat protein